MAGPAGIAEVPVDEVDRILMAYVTAARGSCAAALRLAIADALADLGEAERRTLRRDRLISRGYVRGGLERAAVVAKDPR